MSVGADILFTIMQLKILHVIDNKVMPRQLLQFPKSPFFGSLIIVPVFQSSGVSSSSHILRKIWQRILDVQKYMLNKSGSNLNWMKVVLCVRKIQLYNTPFVWNDPEHKNESA